MQPALGFSLKCGSNCCWDNFPVSGKDSYLHEPGLWTIFLQRKRFQNMHCWHCKIQSWKLAISVQWVQHSIWSWQALWYFIGRVDWSGWRKPCRRLIGRQDSNVHHKDVTIWDYWTIGKFWLSNFSISAFLKKDAIVRYCINGLW